MRKICRVQFLTFLFTKGCLSVCNLEQVDLELFLLFGNDYNCEHIYIFIICFFIQISLKVQMEKLPMPVVQQ